MVIDCFEEKMYSYITDSMYEQYCIMYVCVTQNMDILNIVNGY